MPSFAGQKERKNVNEKRKKWRDLHPLQGFQSRIRYQKRFKIGMYYTEEDLRRDLEEIAKMPISEKRGLLKANWLKHIYKVSHDKSLFASKEEFDRVRRSVIYTF